jgi:hypothetical protein
LLDRDLVALICGSGNQAFGAAERSPESGFRGGASPALADLDRPASILDEVWP